jgi:hypothetical protein
MTIGALLDQAIRERRRMRFNYNGTTRLGEPQCHGLSRRGTELVRVYQVHGGSRPEELFDVAKLEGLELLDDRFEKPGPNYRRNDSAMAVIYSQL